MLTWLVMTGLMIRDMIRNQRKGMMNNLERDRYLTEKMGKCWHDIAMVGRGYKQAGWVKECLKCGGKLDDIEFLDFSTWKGFGILWEWAIKEEWWWDKFYEEFLMNRESLQDMFRESIINPDNFANALYKFLKKK